METVSVSESYETEYLVSILMNDTECVYYNN